MLSARCLLAEAERRREYLASAAYQERHQRLVEWEQKRRAAEAYERFRQQEREGYNATAGKGKSLWQNLTWIRDGLDALGDIRDFALGASAAARAAYRMFPPFTGPNPTWRQIEFQQIMRDAERGVITSEELLERLETLPPQRRINYTELANFVEGVKTTADAGLNLTPLGMQIGAEFVESRNPSLARDLRAGGSTLDGTLNLRQGISQAVQMMQGTDWLGKFMRSPFGKPLIAIQGVVGGFDYVNGAARLISDPSIMPGASKYAWTERVGVATQAIGGVFLAAGAVLAFIPTAQPVAAIFLTAGVTFEGAGLVMQNWGWIVEKTQQLFHRP